MAVPADVLAKLPKGVAGALKERKTIVLGVFADDASNWRPMADDDRYVRNALKKTNRYDGEVFAKNISLSQLSAYGPLVNDLGVNQSPAVVVIDRNLKGTVLTGYVDRIAINQAIADARRDSIDPAITDAYLQKANEICARFNAALRAASRRRRSAARRRATPPWTASSAIGREYAPRGALDAGAREVEGPEGPVAADDRHRRRGVDDAHGRVDQDREPARRPRSPPWASTSTSAAASSIAASTRSASPPASTTAGRRLKRSWTASDLKSTSPRPTGAARCVPGALTAMPGARSAAT